MRLVIDGIDLTTLAIPFYALFMALELLSLRFFPDPVEQGYTVKDTATSLTMGIGSIVCNLGWGLVTVAAVAGVHALAPWHIASSLAGWLVLFVAYDFFYYWEHRANHRVRILWASHVVHHSSRHYNLSTALRQTWTGVGNTIFLLPLALIGFPSYMIFATAAMNLLYQFWIHTERIGTMWRPIEFVMNTPSHHRVHHGSNQGYLDKNYGGVFIVFDRLFRLLRARGRAGGVRADEEHRDVQSAARRSPRICRDRAGRARRRRLAGPVRLRAARPGLVAGRARRRRRS